MVYFWSTAVLFLLYSVVCNYLGFFFFFKSTRVFGFSSAYWLADLEFGDLDAGLCASLEGMECLEVPLLSLN